MKNKKFITRDMIQHNFFNIENPVPVEWKLTGGLVDYLESISFMEDRIKKIFNQEKNEMIWILEHPSIYTYGTNSNIEKELLVKNNIPLYKTKRGGKFTYHGPGQKIIYVMLNLKSRKKDIRSFISCLEEWIIRTLFYFKIQSQRKENHIGVWVPLLNESKNINRLKEYKVASIGVRLWNWISFHGISINIDPNLDHYKGILPCGMHYNNIKSLSSLGYCINSKEFDNALKKSFNGIFGPIK